MGLDSLPEPDTCPGPMWFADPIAELAIEVSAPVEGPSCHADPRLGTVIGGRYRVLAKLGQGGMGVVYLAQHVLLGRKVALKVLTDYSDDTGDPVARFLAEARTASSIGHEGIVDIFDFGSDDDGTAYIAMEHLEGEELSELLESGPVPFARARSIALQLCAALAAAHARGIVHRDLKPENVFLQRRRGRRDLVKLLDFGVADEAHARRRLERGSIIGTPAYLSPEQARGEVADHRADVYALGCVLYEMLTGCMPFEEKSVRRMIERHLEEAPVPPTARAPEARIPRELDEIVLRALAKEPGKRYQSMDDLAKALEALTRDLPTVPPIKQPAKAGRRTRGRAIVLALLLVLGAAVTTVAVRQRGSGRAFLSGLAGRTAAAR